MSALSPALPADRADRALALDPRRSWIVQAPAGSGKTELLIQRYLTLLARVDDPESVLAITFTRKAAAEMRTRVLEALRQPSGEPARAALERDRTCGWNLRDSPTRLRIETIDALSLGIVRRMPWLARFGGVPGLIDDARELYAEAARNTILLVTDAGYSAALETLALHLDNDLERTGQLLGTMLEKRDQWMRHVGAGERDPRLRATLEATLCGIGESHLARLRDVFPEAPARDLVLLARFAAHNLRRENPDHPVIRCANLTGLPDDLDTWLALADLLLTTGDDWRRQISKRIGFPAGARDQKQAFSNLLDRLARVDGLLELMIGLRQLPAPRYSDRQWDFLEALFDILPAAAAQLKMVFQRRGTVDFVELAQAAQRALGAPEDPTDLALALGHRIEHILVDEVQDTSVTQIRMLESLIAGWDEGDGRTLFLVGDPMQSIYRFREAEVGLFLRIRREGLTAIAPEPLTLRVNFRSRPGLVRWVNERLSLTFPPEEEIFTGAVAFNPSAPHREAAEGEAVHIHPFLDDAPEDEARLAGDLVEQALRDFPEGGTAILVRARTHLPAIVRELNRRGQRFRAVEIDLLAERPAVHDLLALTRALLHPADRTAWLAVLRGPWCGLTLDELYRIASRDAYAPIWDLLPEIPRLARVREILGAALARVRRVRLRECVEQAWIALGGPSCVADESAFADARRFLALLEEIEEGGEISDPQALESRVAKLFADPDPSASDRLQVMTIHKAKGLEFDVVIVPGLGYTAGRDDEPLLRWAEVPAATGTQLLFAPVESAADQRDPIYRYLRAHDRRKSTQETVRLLYVAATRARERLHLIGHARVSMTEAGLPLASPRSGSLLECLWPIVEPVFSRALQDYRPQEGASAERPARPIHRLPENWTAPQPPPAIDWRPEGAAIVERAAVTFEWVGDTLRFAGTVVHAFLHRIAREGVEHWDDERVAKAGDAIRTALTSLGVPPADLDAAADRVERALRNTVASERGRWILSRRAIDECEFPASVVEDGAVRHVAIDRTFVDERNTRWIVDYKTSAHGGGDLDAFLDNEIERYREQLLGYAAVFRQQESRRIRCGLYFPLLSGWREFEIG